MKLNLPLFFCLWWFQQQIQIFRQTSPRETEVTPQQHYPLCHQIQQRTRMCRSQPLLLFSFHICFHWIRRYRLLWILLSCADEDNLWRYAAGMSTRNLKRVSRYSKAEREVVLPTSPCCSTSPRSENLRCLRYFFDFVRSLFFLLYFFIFFIFLKKNLSVI